MFETPQVKHAHTTIGTARNEDVHAICTEPHIKDLFVMCNQLGLCGQCRNVPDRARGINARGDDETRRDGVPVKRSERRRVLW